MLSCDSGNGRKYSRCLPSLLAMLLLSGCASFGEGMARALMQQEREDTRQCYVRGQAFDGIEQLIEKTEQPGPKAGGDLKVLMVHGIGTHVPGYSTRLSENLARELKLDVVAREPKVITLRLALGQEHIASGATRGRLRGKPGDKNGTVRVTTYRSKTSDRKMTFYELTWSEITEVDKRIIAYDDSGEYSFRRAGLNKELKQFVNAHLPDPLIYLGDAQLNIQLAVSQTLCWMFTRDFAQLPRQSDAVCQFQNYSPKEVRHDSFVFVSHSLGSRILTDAFQIVTASLAQDAGRRNASPNVAAWRDALRSETLTVFMLSNQLPLLQLGRDAPEVTNQIADYCTPGGKKHAQRVFERTNIVAFSDPNDILSWAVPPAYEDENMDSRMCPNLVNVILNIAEVKTVLGIELAAPGEAHRGYDNDERVIKLMARGMSDDKADPLTKKRCQWMEVR
ncbi:MAG: hypothetical protein JSW09_02775 [Pseudomonadota bacterium]|nr:MAG: hypothetical protein JSW09_02775 [Pseudomonadota bacterium]